MAAAGVAPGAIRSIFPLLPAVAIRRSGLISEEEIEPFLDPVVANTLDFTADAQRDAMRKTALLRSTGLYL